MIAIVHHLVSVDVDPPASADVLWIARTDIGRERRAGPLTWTQFLEWSVLWQVGPNDGVVEQSLAFHVDRDPPRRAGWIHASVSWPDRATRRVRRILM